MSQFPEERSFEAPFRPVCITQAVPPESMRTMSKQKHVLCAFSIINYSSERADENLFRFVPID